MIDIDIMIWITHNMGSSINGGTPKWLVYDGNSQSKLDDLGVPRFQETSKYSLLALFIGLVFSSCFGDLRFFFRIIMGIVRWILP